MVIISLVNDSSRAISLLGNALKERGVYMVKVLNKSVAQEKVITAGVVDTELV